jgi:Zn-dependent protease
MSQPTTDTPAPAESEATGVAPHDPDSAPHSPVFYRFDARKISFGELFRGIATPKLFLTGLIGILLVKVFRLRAVIAPETPAVESLDDFLVPAESIPADIQARLTVPAASLERMKFHSPIYHSIDDPLHSVHTYLATFCHPTLPTVARLRNDIIKSSTPAKSLLYFDFLTAYRDGTFLWTTSSKRDIAAPPSCRASFGHGLKVPKVHEQRLLQDRQGRTPLPAADPDQALDITAALHDALRDDLLSRGLFVPLSPADEHDLVVNLNAREQAAATTSQYPEILAELHRLQNKKTSWLAAVVTLVISLALFLVVRTPGQSSFTRALALVPILLFHESGHYLAMRLCGYKNLRMFFIPGFGAAVSGRSFNVPGWKKAVVALMGPVPGIFLGIIVGLCGIVLKKPIAVEAAFLTLIINGFNLLPIYPFDGGKVLQTTLFSRHYIADAGFRALTAIAIVALGAYANLRFFLGLGIVMLLGVPQSLRTGRIARDLHRAGLKPVSPDNQTIPPQIADQIIAKLKATPKPVHNRAVAQQTLDVFETLNTRPPGVLATLGLLSLHTLSFVAAVVFCFVFVLFQRGAPGHSPAYSLPTPSATTPPAATSTTTAPPNRAPKPAPR